MPEITLREIAALAGGVVIGDGDRKIRGICSTDAPQADMLCVVWERANLASLPPAVPVLSVPGSLVGRDGIEMERPRSALTYILAQFDPRRDVAPGVHPTAFVHPEAVVGEGCAIGPGCVVLEGAQLGERVFLQGNVFVGRGVAIGDDCRLMASVVLQDFVRLGARVTLHGGVVIGDDGFGFEPDDRGVWRKIPQIGTVLLEDDVEIGANSTVDRATFGTTRIRRGTKVGSLTHVAHNCDVGEDCVLTGFIGVGGSVTIGEKSILAGMTGVSDHVKIGSRVVAAGRSGITKDIADGAVVSGFPAQDNMTEKRLQAALRRVPDYAARLKELERIVAELRAGSGGA